MTRQAPAGGIIYRLLQLEEEVKAIRETQEQAIEDTQRRAIESQAERKRDRRWLIGTVLASAALVISAVALLVDKL